VVLDRKNMKLREEKNCFPRKKDSCSGGDLRLLQGPFLLKEVATSRDSCEQRKRKRWTLKDSQKRLKEEKD